MTITTKLNFDDFNASQLSGLWELIVDNLEWIASVLGVIAFIGWIVGFRPRAHRISQTSFIDCESDQILEEIKFSISWGHVFFLRKIKLPPIERDATFKVLCKPLGGIKDTLHMDNYNEKSYGLSRNIYFVNKNFFENNEIEDVFLEITRSAPPDYRDKIEIRQTSGRIEVLNRNHVEVRGLPVELPETITLDKMLAYSALFNEWRTSNGSITAFLKFVPPCIGEKPGKVTIPVN